MRGYGWFGMQLYGVVLCLYAPSCYSLYINDRKSDLQVSAKIRHSALKNAGMNFYSVRAAKCIKLPVEV